jgi:hypothetical protein
MQQSHLKTTKGTSLYVYNGKNYRIQMQSEHRTYYECYQCKRGRLNKDSHGNVFVTRLCLDGCHVNILEQYAKIAIQDSKQAVRNNPGNFLLTF